MSTPKFTPGPWHVSRRIPAYAEGNDFPGVTIDVPDATLAGGYHEGAIEVWGDNCEANAHVIAACPDMYEALKLALKALDAISDEMTTGERYTNAGQYLIDALAPCATALAKAEGKS